VKSESSLIPISAGQVKIIRTIVIPYFIAIYMAEGADPWRPLTPKDFDTLGKLYLRACREPLGHKITEKDEIVKLVCLGNGTGHPRGHQTLTRTLTRAGFDPKHPGSEHKKTRKTVKKRVF
jgi:hypothetical protein